jgi:hypothetical protein
MTRQKNLPASLALWLLMGAGCAQIAGLSRQDLPTLEDAAEDVTADDLEPEAGDSVDVIPEEVVDTADEEEPPDRCAIQVFDIRITDASRTSGWPSLAFNPARGEYGLVWHDERSASLVYNIYMARVLGDGSLADGDTRVTNVIYFSLYPSLAWTGSEYAVAWHDQRSADFNWTPEIYFLRMSGTGDELMAETRVTNADRDSTYPSLVYTGSEYALAWSDSRAGGDRFEIYFVRLGSDGAPLSAEVLVSDTAGASRHPSLVFTGDGFALAWRDDVDGNNEIYFARLDMSGNRLGEVVRLTDSPEDSMAPCLSFNGTDLGLAWYDIRDGRPGVFFARVGLDGGMPAGPVRVSDAFEAPDDPDRLDLEWSGEQSAHGLLWHDDRDGNLEIYFTLLGADGTRLCPDLRVSDAMNNSVEPTLAWGESQAAAAWRDYRHGEDNAEIYLSIVSCSHSP